MAHKYNLKLIIDNVNMVKYFINILPVTFSNLFEAFFTRKLLY